MVRKFVFLLVVILLIAGMIGAFTSTAEAKTKVDWKNEIITDFAGGYNSIAIDSSGVPHISYLNDRYNLMYSEWTENGWTNETVESSYDVGRYNSLVLDGEGDPHISYYDQANSDLKYASKTGGSWVVETVDSEGDVGGHTSITLDNEGHPHISYLSYEYANLKYARWTGNSWETERVRNFTGIEGEFNSLALDSDGDPHISFYNKEKTSLEYASKTGGDWEIETVDHPEYKDVGEQSSLEIDSSDDPHIVYEGYVGTDLKYASRSDGNWSRFTIDSSKQTGIHPSMTVDEDDELHVSYLDYEKRELKYAEGSAKNWNIETIDSQSLFYFSSIAIDDDGDPMVSYYDNENKVLKYAARVTSPSKPKDFQTSSGDENVNLTWSHPSDTGGSEIEQYKIYRGTNSGELKPLVIISGSSTQYTDTTVSVGESYHYKVSALNEVGEGENTSEIDQEVYILPSSPSDLEAEKGKGQINLTWEAPSSNGGDEIIKYKIYRSTSSGDLTYLDEVSADEDTYIDTDVEPEQTYYYKVTAVNDAGESDRSTEVSMTPAQENTDQSDERSDGTGIIIGMFQDYWWLFLGIIIVLIIIVSVAKVTKRGKTVNEDFETEGSSLERSEEQEF